MTPDFTKIYKRCLTGTPRKEDIMRPTFILIDEDGLLNTEQKNTLYENAALGFKLDTFNSLADILDQQGVEVHICKGIPERSEKLSEDYLDEAEMYWRAKLQSKYGQKAEKAIGNILKEREYIKSMKLRGCYFPKRKIIELYPEEMATEYKGKRMNELLVSTLAHEVMHAYFDRAEHDYYPYAYFVEEPLAEFGMLLYLQEMGLLDILDWAKIDVARKQSCYRYGAVLYDQYISWNPFLRRYLEAYKYNINKYEMLDLASGETAVGMPCPISVEPCGVEATATTTSSHCSAPTASHSCGHSMYYKGVVYTLIAEYSTNRSKECIFSHEPNRGFINIPDSFGRHFSLLDSLNLSSKGHCGKHLSVKIIYRGVEVFHSGEASIFKQKTKYSMHLLDDFKHNFQAYFKHLEPKGNLLEVAFYKNVSDDYDWILMVK